MAITKIWSVTDRPDKKLEYVQRPEKSQDGALVFSGHCSTEWELAQMQMKAHRIRFGKDNNNLLYHGCVSFPGNEVSPEQAKEIAIEWMEGKFSNYQYYGSVHVDTENIHFNFIVNAVGLDGKKYNDCKRTLNELRAWTDRICEKHGLEVVIPKDKGVSYKEYVERKKETSWKAQIKNDIDATILRAKTFEDFIRLMQEQGYYMKYGERISHIVFKKKGMNKGCRGRTIGAAYTEEMIKERIRFKEFGMIPSGIHWRARGKVSPAQKYFWGLKHRKTRLSTLLGVGLHIMAGTKEVQFRNSSRGYRQQYEHKMKELSEQLFFVQRKQIHSRKQLHTELTELKERWNQTDVLSVKQSIEREIKQYEGVIQTLEEIKGRNLFPESEVSQNKTKSKGKPMYR